MEYIKMSFVSLQRILRVACKADHLDKYEIKTLKYLFHQCDVEQKNFLVEKFGYELSFLIKEFLPGED